MTGPVLTVGFTANVVSKWVSTEKCESTITISFNARDITGGEYPVTAVQLTVNGKPADTKAGISQVVYQNTVTLTNQACGQTYDIFLKATNSEGITAYAQDTVVAPIP